MADTKVYYAANREKFKAHNKAYYEANKEKVLAQKKKHYEANKEKMKAHRKANPEKYSAQKKAYRERNPEKCKAQKKKAQKRQRDNLLPFYIRGLLRQKFGKNIEITSLTIEAKSKLVFMSRKIKTLFRESKNGTRSMSM